MADVSIYVAIISAAAGLVGATIPQYAIMRRDARQRREQEDDAWRQACLDLLRVAEDLRTQVANNREYYGPEMGVRLAEVRRLAGSVRIHAVEISLRGPGRLADPAENVATAAEHLAVATAERTNLAQGAMIDLPSFRDLDASIEAFRQEVVAEAGGRPSDGNPRPRPAIGG